MSRIITLPLVYICYSLVFFISYHWGYDDMHDDFGFGDRNDGGVSLSDCAKAFALVITNSSFQEYHLITFHSMVARTEINYLLLRKSDRTCKHSQVIPSEHLMTQHML